MNDSDLDQLLGSAQTTVTPPAGFRREVWLRIEAAEAKAWKPRLRLLAERFFNWLALPPVALATCSVMLAAGVWAGLESGNPAPQGEMSYIQSISPFAQTHR
ncbi:MAG: hypothetical protein MUF86_00625 [Akkermansiaceae bacterium]|nr:hypothetical protein [Akkermansiaceae bacterium]MCU0776157.1 hypothetical protein [Akkermansiaceae bacterium]